MENKQEQIHEKGFNMGTCGVLDYSKIKVGPKTLDDAILNLGYLNTEINKRYGHKAAVLKAIGDRNLVALREISNYFYSISGIYQRVCNYFAYLYRYDWYVVPEIYDDTADETKILKEFTSVLDYLDSSHIKKVCGDIALEVIKNGAYYGYQIDTGSEVVLQELPINYCRSRYFVGTMPAVEFNMKFFDDKFRDITYRMRVLKMFPPEFAKGYMLYKQGKLYDPSDVTGTTGAWYLLDPAATVKFSFNNGDIPLFVNSIPAILDLDAAQDLDRRKQMQKLLKIVVQKLPLDKNGDLIFDVDEARDIHNNAVEMLSRAIGVDVLTTFTDVDSIDMSDKNTSTTRDDLEKVERTVFNALGVSQNLFNTDGNLSLEKSILNDESSVRTLLLQFHIFYDRIAQSKSLKRKKYRFRLYMLETTQYNYKDLSKLYKEQVQIGYSKMLPQIALGHSQSSIIHTAFFENQVLHLSEIMIPPLMSSTLSGEDILGASRQSTDNKTQNTTEGKSNNNSSEKTAGRPEKEDDQKSEKTIQNKESMS